MHKAVLLKEAVDGLELKEGETFVDGTLGAGGHSEEVVRRYGEKVRVIGIDQDPDAVEKARQKLQLPIETKVLNFRNIDELGTTADAILLDIGLSSDQLEASGRGFSFQKDEPLDMRMSQSGISAADILNSWDESAIELILRGFGEERLSRKIAEAIVKKRGIKPFETTKELVDTILAVKPRSFHDKIHPATRTFQALRIAVNEELTALEEGLVKGWNVLKPGGRLAVISFHSLEDRIVKNFFRDLAEDGKGELISKKPIVPSDEEVEANPRSRSAKLRIIKKHD